MYGVIVTSLAVNNSKMSASEPERKKTRTDVRPYTWTGFKSIFSIPAIRWAVGAEPAFPFFRIYDVFLIKLSLTNASCHRLWRFTGLWIVHDANLGRTVNLPTSSVSIKEPPELLVRHNNG
jgi:hypothetical protein